MSRQSARPDTWMPFYWGDYLKDTMHLTTAEHGAYMLLIAAYWTNGGPLLDDDAKLRTITKFSPHKWKIHRDTLEQFFDVVDGFWHHSRIDEELEMANNFREKQRANGKKGGRPPKTQTKPNGNPNHNPEKTTSPSPSYYTQPTNLQKNLTPAYTREEGCRDIATLSTDRDPAEQSVDSRVDSDSAAPLAVQAQARSLIERITEYLGRAGDPTLGTHAVYRWLTAYPDVDVDREIMPTIWGWADDNATAMKAGKGITITSLGYFTNEIAAGMARRRAATTAAEQTTPAKKPEWERAFTWAVEEQIGEIADHLYAVAQTGDLERANKLGERFLTTDHSRALIAEILAG